VTIRLEWLSRPTVLPNTHRRRRRDAAVELSRVGVGGVYWACGYHEQGLRDIKPQIFEGHDLDLYMMG